jgi:hypothetical protein
VVSVYDWQFVGQSADLGVLGYENANSQSECIGEGVKVMIWAPGAIGNLWVEQLVKVYWVMRMRVASVIGDLPGRKLQGEGVKCSGVLDVTTISILFRKRSMGPAHQIIYNHTTITMKGSSDHLLQRTVRQFGTALFSEK